MDKIYNGVENSFLRKKKKKKLSFPTKIQMLQSAENHSYLPRPLSSLGIPNLRPWFVGEKERVVGKTGVPKGRRVQRHREKNTST